LLEALTRLSFWICRSDHSTCRSLIYCTMSAFMSLGVISAWRICS